MRELRPDLAILDVRMPGQDGLGAAREITSERLAAVLILTAYSQRNLIEEARDAGALAYLVKPFQRSELIPAIEVALGRHQEMKALEGEVASLEEQLETRRLVDRAKGLLMDNHGLREADAFSFIQRSAMQQRVTMRAIARVGHRRRADAGACEGLVAPEPPTSNYAARRSATVPKSLGERVLERERVVGRVGHGVRDLVQQRAAERDGVAQLVAADDDLLRWPCRTGRHFDALRCRGASFPICGCVRCRSGPVSNLASAIVGSWSASTARSASVEHVVDEVEHEAVVELLLVLVEVADRVTVEVGEVA